MEEVGTRRELLAQGEEVWARLSAVLDAHADVEPEGGWRASLILAHLAHWHRDSADNLDRLLAGTAPVLIVDEAEANDAWSKDDSTLSLEEARAMCRVERARHRQLADSLTDDQWEAWGVRWTSDLHGGRYLAHLKAFEDSL